MLTRTKRRKAYPIKHGGTSILYCAKCLRATTATEATQRIFNTGFSGCCNENLLRKDRRTASGYRLAGKGTGK